MRIATDLAHKSGGGCVAASSFLVWQVYDFAFFVTTFEDVHVSNSIVADSGIGMFMQGHKVISWKSFNLSIVSYELIFVF